MGLLCKIMFLTMLREGGCMKYLESEVEVTLKLSIPVHSPGEEGIAEAREIIENDLTRAIYSKQLINLENMQVNYINLPQQYTITNPYSPDAFKRHRTPKLTIEQIEQVAREMGIDVDDFRSRYPLPRIYRMRLVMKMKQIARFKKG